MDIIQNDTINDIKYLNQTNKLLVYIIIMLYNFFELNFNPFTKFNIKCTETNSSDTEKTLQTLATGSVACEALTEPAAASPSALVSCCSPMSARYFLAIASQSATFSNFVAALLKLNWDPRGLRWTTLKATGSKMNH